MACNRLYDNGPVLHPAYSSSTTPILPECLGRPCLEHETNVPIYPAE